MIVRNQFNGYQNKYRLQLSIQRINKDSRRNNAQTPDDFGAEMLAGNMVIPPAI